MTSRRRCFLAVFSVLSVQSVPAYASDQFLPRPPDIRPPGRTLASTDDSDALALATANIAFLPSWEARITGIMAASTVSPTAWGRGYAVGFAVPLFFGFAAGMRFESIITPKNSSSALSNLSSLFWGIAYAPSEHFSLGVDFRRWFSDGASVVDGALSVGLSASWRPSDFLGLSFAAKNLNQPHGQLRGEDLSISRAFELGFVVRPLRDRSLELAVEGTWWARRYRFPLTAQSEPWFTPRAVIAADIPSIGRASASWQWSPQASDKPFREWMLSAGVEIHWLNSGYGGGILGGKGLSGFAGYSTMSFSGYRSPGIGQFTKRMIRLRVEETPGNRSHVRLLHRIRQYANDDNIVGIAVFAKSELASSTAHAEELASALDLLKSKGKKVLCHFEDVGARSLYACANADKILVHPAGGIRFSGFKSEIPYYGELLAKIGIEADFIRVKEHKSAPEVYVRNAPTETARNNRLEMLKHIEQIYIQRLSMRSKKSQKDWQSVIAQGPFTADEAVKFGLADEKAFDDEVAHNVEELTQGKASFDDHSSEIRAASRFTSRPSIAVVYLDGDMIDGRSAKIPLIGEKLAGSYTIVEALKNARSNPDVKAIIFRIESPGGSTVASDLIWREAERTLRVKPIVVSMGSSAASGGYYAAAFGGRIFANRSSVTGSIGVFYGKADISQFLKKIGVQVHTQKTSPKADAESLYRPFSESERKELSKKVEHFYATFLDRIARGRKMKTEDINRVARGKVWLGEQAHQHKLIDELGGFHNAFNYLVKELELDEETPIVEYPSEKSTLIDVLLGFVGLKSDVSVKSTLPKQLLPYFMAAKPFLLFNSEQPLAHLESLAIP